MVLAAVALATVAATVTPARASDDSALRRSAVTARGGEYGSWLDSLRGLSRKLRARFVTPSKLAALPAVGDSAPVRFLTLRPFADKVKGRIGSYRIGFFPGERRNSRVSEVRGEAYANPEGFLEVTAHNQDTPVSEHFRLRDFITHDQGPVWPKFLVLREPLVDKLELVMDELEQMGIAVSKMRVMSGFRTPQYNAKGVGAGGRARDSRHQYGDAADVYVMNGSRDWMGDLDGDGRVTVRDAKLLASAAERVEQAHPELVGGIGIYPAASGHGPFVHIDVRGKRARWGAQ